MAKMDARTFITKLHNALTRKELAPNGMPTEATDGAGGHDDQTAALKTLSEVQDRISALLSKAGQGGAAPEGLGAELKTLAGMLLTAAGGGDGGEGEAAPSPDGGAAGSMPKAAKHWVIKALAPEVEMGVTVNFVCDKMWGINDMLRKGDVAGAKAQLAKVQEILGTVDAGGAAGEGAAEMDQGKAMTKVVFKSAEQFAAWTTAQLTQLSKDTVPVAKARLDNVTKATKIAKSAFEQTTPETPGGGAFEISMETAYVGSDLPGTPEDLTTKSDQEEEQGPPGKVNDETGEPAGTNISSNGTADEQGAQNTAKTVGETVATLLSEFTATSEALGINASANGDVNGQGKQNTNQIGKRGQPTAQVQKKDGDGEFVWPMDLADYERDEDGARVRRTKADDAPPKRKPGVAVPTQPDDSWGKDPWAAR